MSSLSHVQSLKLMLDAALEEAEYQADAERELAFMACDAYLAARYDARSHCKAREQQLKKRSNKYRKY